MSHRFGSSGLLVALFTAALWTAFLCSSWAARGDTVENGVFDRLVAELSSEDPAVRRAAARGLAREPEPRAIGALRRCLADRDELVRLAAAQALQKLADGLAIDALAATLNDPDLRVRRMAASGLQKINRTTTRDDSSQPVLGIDNALRWLDRTPPATSDPPAAALEMIPGDRIPGSVLAYEPGRWSEEGWLPPHVLVEVAGGGLQRADGPSAGVIRVRTRWLRRVFWERDPSASDEPSTIVTRSGRQVSFRSLRWQPDGVQVLTPEGTRNYRFRELAELHLSKADAWQAWLEQLAWLSPTCSSRLIYACRDGGLRFTCSEQRFRAFAEAASPAPGEWKHLVQPAWSLDPLLTEHLELHLTACLPPHELPLMSLEPGSVRHASPLVGVPDWQTGTNVLGGRLRSGGIEGRWGLGMHADCELQFDVPPLVRAVRTRVGLDGSVGRGGCARAIVRVGGGQPDVLYESPLLVGSDRLCDTGLLEFPPGLGDKTKLVLVADSAHADRPHGADPLNIRDRVDWLEPTLIFDAEGLRGEVARAACGQHPAWQDWEVEVDEGGPAPLAIRADNLPGGVTRFAADVASQGRTITLTATRPMAEADRWLYLSACQVAPAKPPGRFEVRWDREAIAEMEVPRPKTNRPLLVSLAKCSVGGSAAARLQVVYKPGSAVERIAWRALELAPRKTRANWTPLTIVQARVDGVSKLTVEPEGTVFAEGQQNHAETFVIDGTSDLPKITALRLEALADPRLPASGPGRNNNGNFHLAHFQVTAPATSRSPFLGRYVRVSLPGENRQLRLAEVQVFAPPPEENELRDLVSAGADATLGSAGYERRTGPILAILDTPDDRRTWQQKIQLRSYGDSMSRNLAVDGRASQSSSQEDAAARLAIDGNAYAAGAETASQDDPWWEVDLGGDRQIDRIVVWNRPYYYFLDQLRGFEVTVFDSERRVVLHRDGLPDPMPAFEISQSDERVIPLAAAGASAYQRWGDYRGEKSLEFNTRGWSTGHSGQSHAITYVLEKPVELGADGLRMTLRHCRGGVWQTAGTLGRFRLYATADPPPILIEPVGIEVPLLADRTSSSGND